MNDPDSSFLNRLSGYVVYGLFVCLLVIGIWIAVEEMLERIPDLGRATAFLADLDLSGPIEAVIAIAVVLVVLAVLGWLVREVLWDWLEAIPILGGLVSSIDQLRDRLNNKHPDSRELVVWVAWPSEKMHTLAIITGQVPGPDAGQSWLSVVLFPTAGQYKNGMLRIISPELVRYPGWTINEAMTFINSSGAVTGPIDTVE